jgi:nicotinic acid phosphoribosyltransferase
VSELKQVVGDGARLFEVGLRSASCVEQHLLALEACKAEGLTRTSHLYGAHRLSMIPVGTMGHEHVQRFGSDDAAFRAMAERRPHRSSYLLDTFDTMTSGIPTALALIAERKGEGDSIRYDSGDKRAQYRFACERANALGVRPVQILEDSFDLELTREFEALREEMGWKPHEQVYGYGGYLVAATSGCPLTRDRVAAVYKLSMTGRKPTMKFGNEQGEGKQSIPGRPVVFRRVSGEGPIGVVGQEGEVAPEGYALLTGADRPIAGHTEDSGLGVSPQTRAIVEQLKKEAGKP